MKNVIPPYIDKITVSIVAFLIPIIIHPAIVICQKIDKILEISKIKA